MGREGIGMVERMEEDCKASQMLTSIQQLRDTKLTNLKWSREARRKKEKAASPQ